MRAPLNLWKPGTVFPALAAACLSLFVVFLRMGLWNYDLKVPISYWGDSLYLTALTKALTEGSWNYFIPRLGAPFGMDAVDFPLGCSLDFALIKLMSLCVSDPFLLINLYWLLSIALSGAVAALFFRSVRITPAASAVFGVLYAIIPFVFFRNIAHLNLVTFIVPGGAYLGITLAEGYVHSFTAPARGAKPSVFTRRRFFFCLGLCVAIGLTYIYWAFFTCIVLFLGAIIGYSRFRNRNILLAATIYVIVIGAASIGSLSASLLYWHRNGTNPELNYKSAAETDTYGLRIRQMLTPIPDHPLPPWRAARDKVVAAAFPRDANESESAALGTIGGLGFLLLIYGALTGTANPLFRDTRMRMLCGLTLGVVLIAGVAGLGSLFNVFVFHEFRAYNRFSPFVSLFSFGALALVSDRFLASKPLPLQSTVFSFLLLFGALDQIPLGIFGNRQSRENAFHNDRTLIKRLEILLPADAMIFQLPHTTFPMDAGSLGMPPHENAKAYLHSSALRWSWGAMSGRHNDWSRLTAELPPEQFLRRIVFAGFQGILIAKDGFQDQTAVQELAQRLDTSSLPLGSKWLFLDMRSFRTKLLNALTPAELSERQEMARFPLKVEWRGSFSVLESSNGKTWRWCGKTGVLRFMNGSSLRRVVDLHADVRRDNADSCTLQVERPGYQQELVLSEVPQTYRDRFALQPQGVVEIRFTFHGPMLNVPGETRELAFLMTHFSWEELSP